MCQVLGKTAQDFTTIPVYGATIIAIHPGGCQLGHIVFGYCLPLSLRPLYSPLQPPSSRPPLQLPKSLCTSTQASSLVLRYFPCRGCPGGRCSWPYWVYAVSLDERGRQSRTDELGWRGENEGGWRERREGKILLKATVSRDCGGGERGPEVECVYGYLYLFCSGVCAWRYVMPVS